jgi:hypothetical protein
MTGPMGLRDKMVVAQSGFGVLHVGLLVVAFGLLGCMETGIVSNSEGVVVDHSSVRALLASLDRAGKAKDIDALVGCMEPTGRAFWREFLQSKVKSGQEIESFIQVAGEKCGHDLESRLREGWGWILCLRLDDDFKTDGAIDWGKMRIVASADKADIFVSNIRVPRLSLKSINGSWYLDRQNCGADLCSRDHVNWWKRVFEEAARRAAEAKSDIEKGKITRENFLRSGLLGEDGQKQNGFSP